MHLDIAQQGHVVAKPNIIKLMMLVMSCNKRNGSSAEVFFTTLSDAQLKGQHQVVSTCTADGRHRAEKQKLCFLDLS